MSERGHGREPVPEGVTEAKGEKMGREAFRPDARWTAVMVDEGMRVGVNVHCDDHIEVFSLQTWAWIKIKSFSKPSAFFLAGKDAKLAQLDPLTPYVPTARTVEPSDKSRLAAMALPDKS